MELIITAAVHESDVIGALSVGTAQVHSVREDGTMRRRHFLTAEAMSEALWVRAQREGQEADEAEDIPFIAPRSMGSIAREMHVSISAVRRILIDLAITEELMDMDAEELEALFVGAAE